MASSLFSVRNAASTSVSRQFRPVQQAALQIFRIKLIEDHVGTARLVREHVLHALVPMRFGVPAILAREEIHLHYVRNTSDRHCFLKARRNRLAGRIFSLPVAKTTDCLEERFVRFLGYPAEIQREVRIQRTDMFFGRMRKTLEKKVRRPAADHDDIGAVALQGIHQLQQQRKTSVHFLGFVFRHGQ